MGLWSRGTVALSRLPSPETDEGFKDFFSAYDNFKSIRDSDVRRGRIWSSGLRPTGLSLLDGLSAGGMALRHKKPSVFGPPLHVMWR